MKYLFLCITLLYVVSSFAQAKVTPADLELIIGNWEGSLTYLNYGTNEPYTMPANLIVEVGKNEYTLVLSNIYPNEPHANGSYKLKVTQKGTLVNKNKVIERIELQSGTVQVQTESKGKDDGRKAIIKYTYTFGGEFFSMRKDVQFSDSEEWIKRNEYLYRRKE